MGKRRGGTKRVTIRDVARAAGVSVGAASTALSQSRKSNVALSKATRERVMQAARELRYRPLTAARAMAGMKFHTFGVLATETTLTRTVCSHALCAIATEVGTLGYALLLKVVANEAEMGLSSIFSEQQIDGVIIPSDADQRTREALEHYNIPHVWLNTELREAQNCVNVNDAGGTMLAIEHLARLGHRRIGFVQHICGAQRHVTAERQRGYVEGLAQHGLEPLPTYDRYMEIADHVKVYLDMNPRPTALVVHSDTMALLACSALIRHGLRIPQDMSVVGHGGLRAHEFGDPQLTTIRTPALELGRTAVRMLLHQIEHGGPAPSQVLDENLVINGTTAPPPE